MREVVFILAGLMAFAVHVRADDAAGSVVKVDLFGPKETGYALCRIPGLIMTGRGTLIAYCEGRISSGGDWAQSVALMRRSDDKGKTWDPKTIIGQPPADAVPSQFARRKEPLATGFTTNNPLMIAGRDDVVHFFYCVEYNRCFYRRSFDDGKTFTEPREITSAFDEFRDRYSWGVIATGPGHGIELRDGRLVVPIWLSTGANGHSPSCIGTIYSDDSGKTWHAGDIVGGDPNERPLNPSENILVELSDGRVMMNIRHNSEPHVRAVAISPNGATQWSAIRYDKQLPEPVCMASLVRLDAKTILFSNPANGENRDRKNLTIRMSTDDGQTWPTSRTLEPGPSGYSDLAAGSDGSIYCFYERGEKKAAEKLTFVRLGTEWLTGK